jgi:hypothetical protein
MESASSQPSPLVRVTPLQHALTYLTPLEHSLPKLLRPREPPCPLGSWHCHPGVKMRAQPQGQHEAEQEPVSTSRLTIVSMVLNVRHHCRKYLHPSVTKELEPRSPTSPALQVFELASYLERHPASSTASTRLVSCSEMLTVHWAHPSVSALLQRPPRSDDAWHRSHCQHNAHPESLRSRA